MQRGWCYENMAGHHRADEGPSYQGRSISVSYRQQVAAETGLIIGCARDPSALRPAPVSGASTIPARSRPAPASLVCQTNTPSIMCAVGCSLKSCPMNPTFRGVRLSSVRAWSLPRSPFVLSCSSPSPHDLSGPLPVLLSARSPSSSSSDLYATWFPSVGSSSGAADLATAMAFLVEWASAIRRRQLGVTG